MSGDLNHPPAKVIIAFLIDRGLVSDPDDNLAWPCYYGKEPDEPDNCVTVFDTTARLQGRIQFDGEVPTQYGFQVRVRCAPHELAEGYVKCKRILTDFDKHSRRVYVSIGSDTYMLHAVTRQSDVTPLGTETPTSRRRLYVANAVATLRLQPGTGSYS